MFLVSVRILSYHLAVPTFSLHLFIFLFSTSSGRRNMSKYHFNNFGGSVLSSLPPKRFFARFLPRGTQRIRRYITRYVWVSPDVGGACTGRLKSLGLALFLGAASPNQKSRHHDMTLEKEHFQAGCSPL